jgi:hypothetical protein
MKVLNRLQIILWVIAISNLLAIIDNYGYNDEVNTYVQYFTCFFILSIVVTFANRLIKNRLG